VAPFFSGWQLRDVLLATQVALCSVLVLASVVSVRNLRAALAAPVGFAATDVTAAGFDLSAAGYNPRDGHQFKQRALEAARALPGVTAAAFISSLPLTVERSSGQVFPSDVEPTEPRGFDALVYEVSPGLLPLLRVPFIAGRDIAPADDLSREHVAVVNRTFARQVLRTEDAIQMRFRTGVGRVVRVVGLVEDGRYESLSESPKPVMFRPAAQSYSSGTVVLVRSSQPSAVVSRELERIVTGLDPRVPLLSRGSLDEIVAGVFLPARAAGAVMTSFGLLALVLAIVGIYGLAAYSVRARNREIGIRMAIGARPREALTFALGRTAVVLGIGSAVGIAAGVAAAPLLQQITYHASARDPLIVGVVAAVMALIGLGAAWAPARRTIALDPAAALRDA
jgi:predicted permease